MARGGSPASARSGTASRPGRNRPRARPARRPGGLRSRRTRRRTARPIDDPGEQPGVPGQPQRQDRHPRQPDRQEPVVSIRWRFRSVGLQGGLISRDRGRTGGRARRGPGPSRRRDARRGRDGGFRLGPRPRRVDRASRLVLGDNPHTRIGPRGRGGPLLHPGIDRRRNRLATGHLPGEDGRGGH